jgi:N-acetylneuraminate synthase
MPTPHVTVIAEAGVNHNGRLDLALALVDAAAASRADVVKFQTFSAERVVSDGAEMAEYQKRNIGRSEPQLDMLKRLEIGPREHEILIERCRERGIAFLSSPFDMQSLHFLIEQLQCPTIKIPSGEITNGPLLFEVGRAGRRAILSTGMAEPAEIATALDVLAWGYLGRAAPDRIEAVKGARALPTAFELLQDRVVLLQCTTEYPASFDTINLRAMGTLRAMFGLPVGLSDHSEGIVVPIAAAALGAVVIEKHLTLDRSLAGPDHRASIEPDDLGRMVAGIRIVEQALGSDEKAPQLTELANRAIARKSLVAARAIQLGAPIQPEDLTALRPGTGVSPMEYWSIVGRIADRSYRAGELIERPSSSGAVASKSVRDSSLGCPIEDSE